MDLKMEKQLKQAKSLLEKVSWIMKLIGVWPVEKTRVQKIKFIVFVIYGSLHIAMSVNNLVANFNNLKLVTIIFQQVMGIGMTFNRLLFINYSSNVREIIITTKQEISKAALTDSTEKKIFIKLHKAASLYYQVTFKFMIFVSTYYFSTSLYKFITAWSEGKSLAMMLPYKIKAFFINTSSVERTIMLFIYECPMFLMQPNYCASVNMQVIIVMNLSAQMAILAEKIRNIDLNEYSEASNLVIQKVVLRHIELVSLAKKIEDTWTPVYCFELGLFIPLVSLVIYNAMSVLNSDQSLIALSYFIYIVVTLSSLFGHCLMGELVKTQSEHLLEAYYACNWCDMPIKYKKSILICVTYSKIILKITAGRFFVYSLNAYTGMLKSIMAYVSLLREVVQ